MGAQSDNFPSSPLFINSLSSETQHYLQMEVDCEVTKNAFESLSKMDQSRSLLYASQLELTKFESILTFGQDAQKALSHFADRILMQVKRKDISKMGQMLDTLMETLDRIDPSALKPSKPTFFKRIFGSNPAPLKQILTEYERISIQVERMGLQLERAKQQLLNDVDLLEELYRQNKNYYDELSIYISAGYMKRQQVLTTDLPDMHKNNQYNEDPLLFQQINDLSSSIERLDQRIYDLEISQQIAMQMAPQIQMIQQANQTLAEKIQFSIVTLIPLWKNQLAMMLSMNHEEHYARLEERLKHTNESLQKHHVSPELLSQKISHFQETQMELQAAIKDVFSLHKAHENDCEQLFTQLETSKKA